MTQTIFQNIINDFPFTHFELFGGAFFNNLVGYMVSFFSQATMGILSNPIYIFQFAIAVPLILLVYTFLKTFDADKTLSLIYSKSNPLFNIVTRSIAIYIVSVLILTPIPVIQFTPIVAQTTGVSGSPTEAKTVAWLINDMKTTAASYESQGTNVSSTDYRVNYVPLVLYPIGAFESWYYGFPEIPADTIKTNPSTKTGTALFHELNSSPYIYNASAATNLSLSSCIPELSPTLGLAYMCPTYPYNEQTLEDLANKLEQASGPISLTYDFNQDGKVDQDDFTSMQDEINLPPHQKNHLCPNPTNLYSYYDKSIDARLNLVGIAPNDSCIAPNNTAQAENIENSLSTILFGSQTTSQVLSDFFEPIDRMFEQLIFINSSSIASGDNQSAFNYESFQEAVEAYTNTLSNNPNLADIRDKYADQSRVLSKEIADDATLIFTKLTGINKDYKASSNPSFQISMLIDIILNGNYAYDNTKAYTNGPLEITDAHLTKLKAISANSSATYTQLEVADANALCSIMSLVTPTQTATDCASIPSPSNLTPPHYTLNLTPKITISTTTQKINTLTPDNAAYLAKRFLDKKFFDLNAHQKTGVKGCISTTDTFSFIDTNNGSADYKFEPAMASGLNCTDTDKNIDQYEIDPNITPEFMKTLKVSYSGSASTDISVTSFPDTVAKNIHELYAMDLLLAKKQLLKNQVKTILTIVEQISKELSIIKAQAQASLDSQGSGHTAVDLSSAVQQQFIKASSFTFDIDNESTTPQEKQFKRKSIVGFAPLSFKQASSPTTTLQQLGSKISYNISALMDIDSNISISNISVITKRLSSFTDELDNVFRVTSNALTAEDSNLLDPSIPFHKLIIQSNDLFEDTPPPSIAYKPTTAISSNTFSKVAEMIVGKLGKKFTSTALKDTFHDGIDASIKASITNYFPTLNVCENSASASTAACPSVDALFTKDQSTPEKNIMHNYGTTLGGLLREPHPLIDSIQDLKLITAIIIKTKDNQATKKQISDMLVAVAPMLTPSLIDPENTLIIHPDHHDSITLSPQYMSAGLGALNLTAFYDVLIPLIGRVAQISDPDLISFTPTNDAETTEIMYSPSLEISSQVSEAGDPGLINAIVSTAWSFTGFLLDIGRSLQNTVTFKDVYSSYGSNGSYNPEALLGKHFYITDLEANAVLPLCNYGILPSKSGCVDINNNVITKFNIDSTTSTDFGPERSGFDIKVTIGVFVAAVGVLKLAGFGFLAEIVVLLVFLVFLAICTLALMIFFKTIKIVVLSILATMIGFLKAAIIIPYLFFLKIMTYDPETKKSYEFLPFSSVRVGSVLWITSKQLLSSVVISFVMFVVLAIHLYIITPYVVDSSALAFINGIISGDDSMFNWDYIYSVILVVFFNIVYYFIISKALDIINEFLTSISYKDPILQEMAEWTKKNTKLDKLD